MFQIDHYAYANRLLSVHPGEKFAFSFITMVICLASSSTATSLAVIALMAGAALLRAGIPWRPYFKLMTVPAAFLIIGTATIAVSVSSHPGGHLFGVPFGDVSVGIAARDMGLAANIFLKSLGATSCLYFLALTTPMVDIIAVLRKMRVPVLILELMSLIYRFIFVMAETADKIYTSQSSRLGYMNVKNGYSSLGQLVSNLFIKAFYRSRMLFTTLSSRGYTGEIRVLETSYEISGRNILIITVLDLLLVGVTVFSGTGFPGVSGQL